MTHKTGNLIALSFAELDKLKTAPRSVIMVYLSILKTQREGRAGVTTDALCEEAGVCRETLSRAYTSLRMLGLIDKPRRYHVRQCRRIESPQLPLYR